MFMQKGLKEMSNGSRLCANLDFSMYFYELNIEKHLGI